MALIDSRAVLGDLLLAALFAPILVAVPSIQCFDHHPAPSHRYSRQPTNPNESSVAGQNVPIRGVRTWTWGFR